MKKRLFFVSFLCAFTYVCLETFTVNFARAEVSLDSMPCSEKPEIQKSRSEELQKLYNEDQSDYRKTMVDHPGTPLDVKKLQKMGENDLKRRKRVGEILAEGCFKTADDYKNAAMIYQHGNAPDHFFQAFLWAKKAVDLGDEKEKSEMALAIDRYLVSIGHKQLFGSQLFKPGAIGCYCLQPIEESFPQSMRDQYLKAESYGENLLKHFNGTANCPQTFCSGELQSSPQGTVVGFW